jgi:hypothetical protein
MATPTCSANVSTASPASRRYRPAVPDLRLVARTADRIAGRWTGAQDYLGLTGDGNLVTYDADPRDHPGILATPSAVILHHQRIR